MYRISAAVYDLLHTTVKDYRVEAAAIARAIRSAHPQAERVLDIACGTGEHARFLTEEHDLKVDGLDLRADFAEAARKKLPDATVIEADMRRFELPGRYDVVLCLFSSIGYLLTPAEVTQALARFAAHLAPGGVVVVEPWFAPDTLTAGRTNLKSAETEGLSATRMSRVTIDGRRSRIDFHYLVGDQSGIHHVHEVHDLALYTSDELLGCFRAAGLEAMFDPQGITGRGLFVARRG